MKKWVLLLLVIALAASVVLAGCSGGTADGDEDLVKMALLINGNLGDKSFFDSANAGVTRAMADFPVDVKVIEMGLDPSKWEPTLADVATQDYEVIIVGTWQMTEHLEKIANQYPEKKFMIFDTAVNYAKEGHDLSNVYSILYAQNEGSFLAGALAAMVTNSDLPLANDSHTIGFLGGMDIPVINDFLVGYIEGAKTVDPEIKVAVSYVGSFGDPAKGKEMALAQYQMGADIGFNVAGETGLGQLDAAKEMDRYALGVDSDQAMLFKDSDPDKAALIVASMMKRVDNSLYRAIDLYLKGELTFGQSELLGLADGAVGLTDNEITAGFLTDEWKATLADLQAKIISGEIVVGTAFGMTNEDLEELRASVRP